MTTLHDRLADAVDGRYADLDRITLVARRQGLRRRRRRHAVTAVGSVAAAGVIGASAFALHSPARAPGSADGGATATDPTSTAPAAVEVVRADGRSSTAALRDAVLAVADGRASSFAGQDGPSRGDVSTYGELTLTPADGTGAGLVGLNIQAYGEQHGDGPTCAGSFMTECHLTRLDHAVLRTYVEVADTVDGVGKRAVAEVVTDDHVRVVATAANGFELPANRWDVRRAEPVLSVAQLTDIVEQKWWGATLPSRFADEGVHLPAYDALAGQAEATTPSSSDGASPSGGPYDSPTG